MDTARAIGVFAFDLTVESRTPTVLLLGEPFEVDGGDKVEFSVEIDHADSDAELVPALAVHAPVALAGVTPVSLTGTRTTRRFEFDVLRDAGTCTVQAAVLANLARSSRPGDLRGRVTVLLHEGPAAAGAVPVRGVAALRASLFGPASPVAWELYVRGPSGADGWTAPAWEDHAWVELSAQEYSGPRRPVAPGT